MDLMSLFAIQQALDERILAEHGLHRDDLFMKKILALQVEVGEFANETRIFKYWSHKPAAPRATLLEEYVDAMHFVLSLGLDLRFAERVAAITAEELVDDRALPDRFVSLYASIAQLACTKALGDYLNVLHGLLAVGRSMGFADEEIEAAYRAKNAVNHQRQEQGY